MTTDRQDRDVLLAVSLFLLGILTRLPFRSQILYHWDSVNFALALDHFDVRIHQPQPPGYILYILLGRAFNTLLHNPNVSLVWISILFSGLTVAAIFWLARTMFGRQVGLVSASLALTSPLFWFHGEVALSYIVEGFFVTVIALCCYKQLTGDEWHVLSASLALGVAGGFRQNTLVLLFPLWLFSTHRLRWRKRVAAVVTLALVVGLWLTIMLHLSGGIANYWQAFNAQSRGNLAISAAAVSSLLVINMLRLTIYAFYALTAGLPLLFLGFWWALRHWHELFRTPKWQVLAIWSLPGLAFYAFFVQQAGYVFTFMPAVMLFLGFIVVEVVPQVVPRWKHSWQLGNVFFVLITLANIAFFLSAPPFLFGQERQLLNTPSWPSIRTRNIIVGEKLKYIREHFLPESTAVLATKFDFRLPAYYLSDYQYTSLSYQLGTEQEVLENVYTLVLFNTVLHGRVSEPALVHSLPLPSGGVLHYLDCSDGQAIVISRERITCQRQD